MTMPRTGFCRLKQIIGDPTASPAVPAVLPISKSAWWDGIKRGKYPAPIKLGPRTTAWRWSDIAELVDRLSSK